MLLKLNKYTFLVFAVCFFAAAVIIENHLLREHPETHVTDDIQKRLHKFELELSKQTQAITSVLTDSTFDGSYFEALKNQTLPIDETGTAYLVYESGKLVYWSDDYEYNRMKNAEQEEINRILEKIAKSGYDSLTKGEKELLFKQGKS